MIQIKQQNLIAKNNKTNKTTEIKQQNLLTKSNNNTDKTLHN